MLLLKCVVKSVVKNWVELEDLSWHMIMTLGVDTMGPLISCTYFSNFIVRVFSPFGLNLRFATSSSLEPIPVFLQPTGCDFHQWVSMELCRFLQTIVIVLLNFIHYHSLAAAPFIVSFVILSQIEILIFAVGRTFGKPLDFPNHFEVRSKILHHTATVPIVLMINK